MFNYFEEGFWFILFLLLIATFVYLICNNSPWFIKLLAVLRLRDEPIPDNTPDEASTEEQTTTDTVDSTTEANSGDKPAETK